MDNAPPPSEAQRRTDLAEYDRTGDCKYLFNRVAVAGRGSFGIVYACIDNRTAEEVAVKVIDFDNVGDDLADIAREVTLMASFNSPYVTKYYGSYIRTMELWILMELLKGGTAADLMKPGIFGEKYIRVILRDVLHGLQYLHANGVIHRDIKGSNIMVTTEGQIKLVDFGVAASLERSSKSQLRRTIAGTPLMMAPEMIREAGYDFKVDIWALGITALELAYGRPPRWEESPARAMIMTATQEPPKLLGNFSEEFKNFVSLCLQKDPSRRPTTTELLQHPFVLEDGGRDLLMELVDRWLSFSQRFRKPAADMKLQRDLSLSKTLQRSAVDRDQQLNFWDFDEPGDNTPTSGSKNNDEMFKGLLEQHNLGDIYSVLQKNDVDIYAFVRLKEKDMTKMGFTIGQKRRVEGVIELINSKRSGGPSARARRRSTSSNRAESPEALDDALERGVSNLQMNEGEQSPSLEVMTRGTKVKRASASSTSGSTSSGAYDTITSASKPPLLVVSPTSGDDGSSGNTSVGASKARRMSKNTIAVTQNVPSKAVKEKEDDDDQALSKTHVYAQNTQQAKKKKPISGTLETISRADGTKSPKPKRTSRDTGSALPALEIPQPPALVTSATETVPMTTLAAPPSGTLLAAKPTRHKKSKSISEGTKVSVGSKSAPTSAENSASSSVLADFQARKKTLQNTGESDTASISSLKKKKTKRAQSISDETTLDGASSADPRTASVKRTITGGDHALPYPMTNEAESDDERDRKMVRSVSVEIVMSDDHPGHDGGSSNDDGSGSTRGILLPQSPSGATTEISSFKQALELKRKESKIVRIFRRFTTRQPAASSAPPSSAAESSNVSSNTVRS